MKNLLLISVIIFFISCKEDTKESYIEGGWEWTKTVNYKNNVPQDTIPRWMFKGKEVKGSFLKFFIDDYMVWVGRRITGDSTANANIDKGAALLGKYTIKNDTLTESLLRGTDWANNWIKNSGGPGHEYIAVTKIIDENTFSQRKIDEPNAREEIWERISSADDKLNLDGAYTSSGRQLIYKNNILSDSVIRGSNNTTTFGDRFYVSDYEILIYNRFNPDSNGNDVMSGMAYVGKLDKINDSIFSQKFITNTRNIDKNLSLRISNKKNIRMFKRTNNNFLVTHPDSDLDSGNLRIVYFEKLNK